MANVKVWSGQKPAPTYYCDMVYPKKVESGTIRIVMRNQQGVIIENLMDIIPEKGVVLLPVSAEFAEQFPCEGGKLKVVEGEIVVVEKGVGSGIAKKAVVKEVDEDDGDINEAADVM